MNVDITNKTKEIANDLARKLKSVGESDVEINVLTVIVKTVIREFIQKRDYPSEFKEEEILADIDNYYSTIFRVAEYDYNMIGAEGQTSHSENGISRRFVDRDSLFADVYKYVRFM